MTLLDLFGQVSGIIGNVIQDGDPPSEVQVAVQVEDPDDPDNTICAYENATLEYDGDMNISGCVLQVWKSPKTDAEKKEDHEDFLRSPAAKLAYECARLIAASPILERGGMGDALLAYLRIGSKGEPDTVQEWCAEYEAAVCPMLTSRAAFRWKESEDNTFEKLLQDNGYATVTGADEVLELIESVSDGSTQELCSGHGVFPNGTRCPGCTDCMEDKTKEQEACTTKKK